MLHAGLSLLIWTPFFASGFVSCLGVGISRQRAKKSQLHMNLPGQVSKKVIVTGAGTFSFNLYIVIR
jgi:hypothetical protein